MDKNKGENSEWNTFFVQRNPKLLENFFEYWISTILSSIEQPGFGAIRHHYQAMIKIQIFCYIGKNGFRKLLNLKN